MKYKYQNKTTKEIKTYRELRKANPNVSLPRAGTTPLLGGSQILISPAPQPEHDEMTQGVREIDPVDYAQTWEVYTLTQEEIDANIADLKYRTKEKLKKDFDVFVKRNIYNAPDHEVASWRKQEEQARAWNADNAVSTPTIDALLEARSLGETKQELVDKIIANANAYEAVYAPLLGKYQSLEKQIDRVDMTASDTRSYSDMVAEINSITW